MGSAIPLISVLVPAYNHERYIESCIRSVLAQDWPRIELIVLDDGSDDSTYEILQRLRPECELRLERVFFEEQGNHGVCHSLNRLVSMARGDFVATLDSDDRYLPGAFSVLMQPLLNNPEIGVVVGQNELMDSEGRTCFWTANREITYESKRAKYVTFNEYLCHKNRVQENDGKYGSYPALVRGNHIPNGLMIRKTALDAVMPYPEESIVDDFWLQLQLSKIVGYAAISSHTYAYRWHGSNTVVREEYMKRRSYLTYQYEYAQLIRSGDAVRLGQFTREVNRVLWLIGIGNVLALRKIRTFDEKRIELDVLGVKILLKRKMLA